MVTEAIIASHTDHCVIITERMEKMERGKGGGDGDFMTPYCQHYFITHSFTGVIKNNIFIIL